jgi:hypothetical protein
VRAGTEVQIKSGPFDGAFGFYQGKIAGGMCRILLHDGLVIWVSRNRVYEVVRDSDLTM